ncbi:MAG: DUF853 domain-containing protein [Rhodocyclaceae bacterium]|nr:DUF853 domain-containing protein [Rhodocyclaceae bacterium]
MTQPLVIAKSGELELALLPALANRHGLITGATGTGKTVTLQVLAERFSSAGVPVFMADVKGDLSGLAAAGVVTPKLKARLESHGMAEPVPAAFPAVFWDVFGESGHPVRATVSDMGPLLLGRLLNLNDTQAGVLQIVFRIADDAGLLLLDLKDLRAMVQYVGENAKQFTTEYGNVSAASVGAIQRALLQIEEQGGASFFGEPMLDIADLMQTDERGPWRRQHPCCRPAAQRAAPVLDLPAVAAVGALRAVARGGRPGQAQAGVLLRRGAPALQ